jgi:hypothetical protein
MTRLIANQIGVVAAADAALAACGKDISRRILERVTERETGHLSALRELLDQLRQKVARR